MRPLLAVVLFGSAACAPGGTSALFQAEGRARFITTPPIGQHTRLLLDDHGLHHIEILLHASLESGRFERHRVRVVVLDAPDAQAGEAIDFADGNYACTVDGTLEGASCTYVDEVVSYVKAPLIRIPD